MRRRSERAGERETRSMSRTRLGVSAKRTLFLAVAGGLAVAAMACSAGGAPSQPTQAPAAAGAVQNATNAKIPVVAFNSGLDNWQQVGTLMYFGQDENLAGQTAGQRLSQEGLKHALCVVQEQGHVALEARCAGVKSGLSGGQTENLYVTGTNMPSVRSTIAAKLQSDSSIDSVITLGAPFALTAVQSVKDAGSKAKVYTFDTNAELVNAVKSGDVQWAIHQQPYLQGYLAVDSLWLYLTNGDIIGGGKTVLTGPSFITKDNIEAIAQYASKGTR